MDVQLVEAVRKFNRTVTERIGALDDEYLARGRPLGASRLLWEIGSKGTTTKSLRATLGLDSGYLSRLLRLLEDAELVTVGADPDDQRVRVVRMTTKGRNERRLLDRRSDKLAWSLLEPLDDKRRIALVEAMSRVDQLLSAGAVQVAVADPRATAAQFCLRSYLAELDSRFETGFDPGLSISADADELVEPNGLLLVARLRGQPIGCGALKFHGAEPAEIKRMWVAASARGLGVGRRLLDELERCAASHGVTTLHLETNRSLVEAIALYRTAGYREMPRFNDEPYADHWFEKRL